MSDVTARAIREAEQRVAHHRALARADPATHESELALALYALCLELKDFRGPVSTTFVDLCDEAITLHRRLLDRNPASYPQLGLLLGWRGFVEYRRGSYERAAALLEESVSLLRVAARRISDEVYEPQLAKSLGILAFAVSSSGDHPAAISAARESVAIWRDLGGDRLPDVSGDLAAALHTLCHILQGAGRPPEMLGPAEESVVISRRHLAARTDPDMERLLANGLDLQTVALSAHERWQEALSPAEEAVRLYRRVHRKGHHNSSTGYAGARINYGILLHRAGQVAEAKYQARLAALELLRRARDTGDPVGLAEVVARLSGLLNDLGMTRSTRSLVAKVNARLQPHHRGLRRLFARGRT